MPIIGFSLSGIEAKKFEIKGGKQINVNSRPNIKNVKEVSLPNLKKKALSIDFEFTTTYEPKVGEIKINGNLLVLANKNETVLKEWKKNKKLPSPISLEILNYLFRKCLLKMTNISEYLQLPLPLQFPFVKPKTQKEPSYVG